MTPLEFTTYTKEDDNDLTGYKGKPRKTKLTIFKEDVSLILKSNYTQQELQDKPCTILEYYQGGSDAVCMEYEEVKKLIL